MQQYCKQFSIDTSVQHTQPFITPDVLSRQDKLAHVPTSFHAGKLIHYRPCERGLLHRLSYIRVSNCVYPTQVLFYTYILSQCMCVCLLQSAHLCICNDVILVPNDVILVPYDVILVPYDVIVVPYALHHRSPSASPAVYLSPSTSTWS